VLTPIDAEHRIFMVTFQQELNWSAKQVQKSRGDGERTEERVLPETKGAELDHRAYIR